MTITIRRERADTPEAVQLITELEDHLDPFYPPESRHGFSIEKLLQDDVAFFVTYVDGQAAGCGGVKLFATEYGEVKRMYVRQTFRGMGLGRHILDYLATYTLQQGATVLRLETGIYQANAIHLYERWGFVQIPPFGEYRPDPLSLFYEKHIQ